MKTLKKTLWIVPLVALAFVIASCFGDNGPKLKKNLGESVLDADNDGYNDNVDNCPAIANPEQEDKDCDDIGDVCDTNPDVADQNDANGNGMGDRCDEVTPPPPPPAGTATEVSAVKMMRQDNVAIDLLVATRPPIPLRPQYIEVTFLTTVNCDTVRAHFSLMLGDTAFPDVNIECTETTAKMTFNKNLAPRTDYKLQLTAWEAANSQLAFTGKDITFHTMTKGDIDGDGVPDIAVGAPEYSVRSFLSAGAAYVYSGKNLNDPVIDPRGVAGNGSGWQLGKDISMEEDINGDGYVDLILGCPGFVLPSATIVKGAVFVVDGYKLSNNITANQAIAVISPEGAPDGSKFGSAIDTGDINNDGFPDIVVGAPLNSGGAVYVYDGRKILAGASDMLMGILQSGSVGAKFGTSLDIADINADDYEDITIGAPGYDSNKGAVGVYSGAKLTAGDFSETARFAPRLIGDAGSEFGTSVASADIDGDQIPDILVGAPIAETFKAYNGSELAAGRMTLFRPRIVLSPDSKFGSAVIGNDINEDGYADIIVGAPVFGGAIYIYNGQEFKNNRQRLITVIPFTIGERFGSSISDVGDINGDEVPDIIVGAPGAGWVEVYSGKALNGHTSPLIIGNRISIPNGVTAQFGAAVAGGGQ